MTPEKLALGVALGMTLGVFPVLGITTVLCVGVGLALGLNQPAIQSVNYITYPVQLALLIPFFRLGEWLFRAPPLLISREGVQILIRSGVSHAMQVLWSTSLHAIVAWGLLSPGIAAAVYFTVLPLFRRFVVVE